MSYVERNLTSGEKVIYNAKVHWLTFAPGSILILAIFPVIIGAENKSSEGAGIIGLILLCLGSLFLIRAFFIKISTELTVTSKRVVAKIGLVRRTTMELNHRQVESFSIRQGLLGRILGYGTIVVNGTGGGRIPVRGIGSPLEFRRRAMETIDQE